MEHFYWKRQESVAQKVFEKRPSLLDMKRLHPDIAGYFAAFKDRLTSLAKIGEGLDSTVFLVELKNSPGRTQLVKVYDKLYYSCGKDTKKTTQVLEDYFSFSRQVGKYFENDSNPLHQTVNVKNEWGRRKARS